MPLPLPLPLHWFIGARQRLVLAVSDLARRCPAMVILDYRSKFHFRINLLEETTSCAPLIHLSSKLVCIQNDLLDTPPNLCFFFISPHENSKCRYITSNVNDPGREKQLRSTICGESKTSIKIWIDWKVAVVVYIRQVCNPSPNPLLKSAFRCIRSRVRTEPKHTFQSPINFLPAERKKNKCSQNGRRIPQPKSFKPSLG